MREIKIFSYINSLFYKSNRSQATSINLFIIHRFTLTYIYRNQHLHTLKISMSLLSHFLHNCTKLQRRGFAFYITYRWNSSLMKCSTIPFGGKVQRSIKNINLGNDRQPNNSSTVDQLSNSSQTYVCCLATPDIDFILHHP